MRILMISDFYHPFVGGVEQHVRTLSSELSARGHHVSVVTLGQKDLPEADQDGPVRVYRLNGTMARMDALFANPGRRWAPPFPDPEGMLGLQRVMKEEQPDIVHGHDWLARSYVPLKPFHRARFVVSLHYYSLACPKKNLMYMNREVCRGPELAKCLRCGLAHYGRAKGAPVVLGNMVFGAAERATVDLFLPVSRFTAEGNGLEGSGLPYEIVPNFVPDHVTRSSGDLAPYLAQLPTEPYFLFVGDLRGLKGLDVLLEAFAGLDAAPPLLLIGKVWGETPESFPPNVIVRKNWPNFAVMEAWRRSLAAVVPSVWPEPFGIVVIEAMDSGKPVIGSRTGGIPDMVKDGENGFLVPPGDAVALREAMRRLITDRALAARMGQAGKARMSEFRASAVVPRIESLYARLLQPLVSSKSGVIAPGTTARGAGE